MSLQVEEFTIHKNRGKNGMVLLVRVDMVEVQMKTKTKMAPQDVIVGEIPKDDCFSRLDNWRKLLNNKNDHGDRRIRLLKDGDTIQRADLYVRADDPLVWDSPPLNWSGEGWIPFFLKIRPKEAKHSADENV